MSGCGTSTAARLWASTRTPSGLWAPSASTRGRLPTFCRRLETAEEQAHGHHCQTGVPHLVEGRRRHAQAGPALFPVVDLKGDSEARRRTGHTEVPRCGVDVGAGRGAGFCAGPGAGSHPMHGACGGAQEMWRGAGGGADPARLRLEAVELPEHGVTAFDHRRLLGEDELARAAKHLGVLKGDVGEHDDRRADDVRRVEAAAEPRFERGGLHPSLGQRQQSRDREHLELRGVSELRGKMRDGKADGLHGAAKQALVHRAAVHEHALGPARDMRREVAAGAQTVGA